MSTQEFSMEELIALVESKDIDGNVSLTDIAHIVFDTRFPNHLSKNAEHILIKFSKDFK